MMACSLGLAIRNARLPAVLALLAVLAMMLAVLAVLAMRVPLG